MSKPFAHLANGLGSAGPPTGKGEGAFHSRVLGKKNRPDHVIRSEGGDDSAQLQERGERGNGTSFIPVFKEGAALTTNWKSISVADKRRIKEKAVVGANQPARATKNP